MMQGLSGIHHVTAICRDAQTNIDFYTQKLGLRLIKLTVNFDDPSAYHLYYGDSVGTPGTVVTFFPYSGHNGKPGDGAFSGFTLAVPDGSLDFWQARLNAAEVAGGDGARRLRAYDPDGIAIDFIEAEGPEAAVPHVTEDIGREVAIRGVDRVTLSSKRSTTMIFTSEYLGFKPYESTEAGDVLSLNEGKSGSLLEVVLGREPAIGGPGSIHHVAWRVADDANQLLWQRHIAETGANVSPVMDRDYFHSIYFREPGGALFEIATDGPGFATDESLEELGSSLKLPKHHEARRSEIEALLPPLKLPKLKSATIAG